jgi:C4-dicarboxylate-specific signal transduction histidine kinase
MQMVLKQVSGKTKLRRILVVPFVLQIVATVGLVGYLSFRNGQQAVTELVYKLQHEISNRVDQHLDSYTEIPNQVHKANLVTIRQGLFDLNDLQKSQRYFWQQAKVFKELSFIGYYLENNSGVGSGLLDPSDKNPVNLYHPPGGLTEYNYETDDQGSRTKLLTKIEYNAIAQAWYVDTKKTKRPTWRVFAYPDIDGYVAATLSSPILDQNHKFLGVLSTDLTLPTVSDFLRSLKVSPNGKIFIIERDGMLIASSSADKPYKMMNHETKRIHLNEVTDRFIQVTSQQLQQRFSDLKTIQAVQQFSFPLSPGTFGQRQYVQVTPWQDTHQQLDWLIVVTVPESDFMAQINTSSYITAFLCLGALTLATIIGLWTAQWITRPILKLNQAAKAIATGDFAQAVRFDHLGRNHPDELEELSRSFNTMATQLQMSFHELKSLNIALQVKEKQLELYNETLEQQVKERTQTLSETLAKLQLAQDEAIQSEKMAALGHLVAGIAHEINTPLGAIRASISNINNALDRSLQELPPLIQSLSNEQLEDFFVLLDLAKRSQVMLSSREERQLKRSLKQTLQAHGLPNAESLAGTLSKMGIQTSLEPILSLLNNDNAISILDTAYQLSSVQNNSQNIQIAIERASRIVYALKNYVRQDMSGVPISTSITESIDLVLTLYQNQIKRGIEVIRVYQPDLPLVIGYPDELAQVWSNLISNAIQAMNYNGTLTIAVSQQEQSVLVQVRDRGSGIPDAIQTQIFQPFFTTKPAGEGSGLGLSIVRKIIDKHQGHITVTSKPGDTTFNVFLPLNFQILV